MSQPNPIQPVEDKQQIFSFKSFWSNLSLKHKLILVTLGLVVALAAGFLVYILTKSLVAGFFSSLTAIGSFFGIGQQKKRTEKKTEEILVKAEQRIVKLVNDNVAEVARKEVAKVRASVKSAEVRERVKQVLRDAEIDRMVKELPPEEVNRRILELADAPEEEF